MKIFVAVFYLNLLLWSVEVNAQSHVVYYSIEEAGAVPVDSVFRLDLSKKKYSEIPSEIYRFKNLRELNLSQNKLTHLPDDFYFPNLEVLNLEKNDLDTFSNCICQITTLRQLYLGRNEIRYFPECIGNLQELVILDAWFNPIQDLPVALTSLKKLRAMDLRGITYSKAFIKKWTALLPWVKIEFDVGCDCAN